jgi:hypothetical protein
MPSLKLARLPDRVPVKLTFHVLPDLHQALVDYAALYAEIYAESAKVDELVPAMLASFLESDRGFVAARTKRAKTSPSP